MMGYMYVTYFMIEDRERRGAGSDRLDRLNRSEAQRDRVAARQGGRQQDREGGSGTRLAAKQWNRAGSWTG